MLNALLILFLLAIVIAALPAIARGLRREMNAEQRANAPGQFVDLTGGKTHFEWHGPPAGPVFVLVHGLTTPSFVFAAMIPTLTAAGYRVLTYDLFGRGYSDRPHGKQTAAFFTTQLSELLDSQMVQKPFALLGYSMGGAIVSSFAHRFPERLSHVVLLAPAGFKHDMPRMMQFIRDVPGVGDWLMTMFGGARIRKAALAENQGSAAIHDIGERIVRETRFRGYTRSVLSSLRNILNQPYAPLWRDMAAGTLPVLAIWGREDLTIPIGAADVLKLANEDVFHEFIDGADHTLAYSAAEDVTSAILTFTLAKE